MPLIILEGPDGGGKSVLAQALLTEWDGPSILFQRNSTHDQILEHYGYPLVGHDYKTTLVVCDRWLMSEDVYGQVYRGGTRATEEERKYIEGLLLSFKALTVVLCPSPKELRRRVIARGAADAGMTLEELVSLRDAYTIEAARSPIRLASPVSYDYSPSAYAKELLNQCS